MTKLLLLVALLFGTLTPASAAAPDALGIGCSSTRSCTPGAGGAFMTTSRNSCTAALPVRSRATGAWYVLTAGHCVARSGSATWTQSGRTLGVGRTWAYGGLGTQGGRGSTDAGVIRYTGTQLASRVLVVAGPARLQKITSVRAARAGERVCVTAGRSGRTQCGTVTTASTSLRYASPGVPARTVHNLAMVRGVCVLPGDSGSPVYAGSAFVGIAVAKAATGCTLWYARADAAFAQLGVKLG